MGFKTKEGIKDFAELGKRIIGNEVGAVGDIGKALRKSYTREVGNLSGYIKKLERNGESLENIARAASKKRRDLGIKYKAITPQKKLESFFARNVEKYGDKWGPSVEYLRSKGKSWEQIIESAAPPGGADLGL